jgi:L-alanine-DL-glutamate epimerase-like enolase superfamily enzyme
MKIERIRFGQVPIEMRRPMRTAIHSTTHTHNALVEITAGGLVGEGAALTLRPHHAGAVCRMIQDLAGDLIGRDPSGVVEIWGQLWQQLNLTGQSGIGVLALAAIDTALWDLMAQQAGVPLHRLLGSLHDELPIYVQPGWLSYSIPELLDEALGYEAQGYRFYKMRVGARDWRGDVERVSAVREALSSSTALMVDANQGWSRLEARQALKALDGLGLYWIEEPLDVSDVVGLVEIAQSVSTPIAAGETVFGVSGAASLIDARAVSVLMPDLQHCAGPTGFRKVAALAENAHVPISNHLFTQVSVHLMAAAPNGLIVELMPGWWDDLFDRTLDISNGMIRPPSEAGVGYRFCDSARNLLTDV